MREKENYLIFDAVIFGLKSNVFTLFDCSFVTIMAYMISRVTEGLGTFCNSTTMFKFVDLSETFQHLYSYSCLSWDEL